MNANNRLSQISWQGACVPQMRVRSDVRSGGDLQTCQYNLNKWKDRYYYWYNQAKAQGKI
jgi:hypothetical protein